MKSTHIVLRVELEHLPRDLPPGAWQRTHSMLYRSPTSMVQATASPCAFKTLVTCVRHSPRATRASLASSALASTESVRAVGLAAPCSMRLTTL